MNFWNNSNQHLTNPIDVYVTGNPQITFLKTTYRRHSEMHESKKIYDFINNMVTIESDEQLEAINETWINNVDNIKWLYVFIVNHDFNVESINFSENLENNDNFLYFHKMDSTSLKVFHMQANKKTFDKSEYWCNIPSGHLCMVLSLLKSSNKKVLFYIERYDELIENKLFVKTCISDNLVEINRFKVEEHEYLIKKHKTYCHQLTNGNNIINFDHLNVTMPYMYIMVPKNKSTSIKIKYETNGVVNNDYGLQFEPTIREVNLIKSSEDPEISWIKDESNDIYFLEGFANVPRSSGTQPCGIISVKNSGIIEIESRDDITISVTYTIFDVLRYIGNQVGFEYSHTPPRFVTIEPPARQDVIEDLPASVFPDVNTNPLNPPDLEDVLSSEEPNNNVELVNDNNDSEHISESDNDYYPNSNIQDLNLYTKKFLEIVRKYEEENAICEELNKENSECQISWRPIEEGEYFYKCDRCKKIFGVHDLRYWFTNQKKSTCPCCRKTFTSFPQLFKRKSQSSANTNKSYYIYSSIMNWLIAPVMKIPQC